MTKKFLRWLFSPQLLPDRGRYAAVDVKEDKKILLSGTRQQVRDYMRELKRNNPSKWEDCLVAEMKEVRGHEEIKRFLLWD